jgi:hypothetical protein
MECWPATGSSMELIPTARGPVSMTPFMGGILDQGMSKIYLVILFSQVNGSEEFCAHSVYPWCSYSWIHWSNQGSRGIEFRKQGRLASIFCLAWSGRHQIGRPVKPFLVLCTIQMSYINYQNILINCFCFTCSQPPLIILMKMPSSSQVSGNCCI